MDSPTLPVAASNTSSNGSSRITGVTISLLIVNVLVFSLLGFFMFYILPQKFVNPQVALNTNGLISLPISLQNPALQNYAFVYKFKITIKDLKKNESGIEIIPNEANIPPVIVTSATQIFRFDSYVTPTYSNKEELKAGQTLSINEVYTPEKNQWTTSQIYIYQK